MQTRNPALRSAIKNAEENAGAPTGSPVSTDYSNPTGSIDQQLQDALRGPNATNTMQLPDVIAKTGLMFAILLVGAVFGWTTAMSSPWVWMVGAVGAMILGLVNAFKRKVSPPLVMAYAVFEGVLLGGLSHWYNEMVAANSQGVASQPIVLQAVIGTFVAFAVMLALYSGKVVKVNGTFKKVFFVAIISYLVIGLASLVAALFGVGGGWGFYGVGGIGIVLCLFGVALAAFSLVMDFESIQQGIAYGLPERESWRMAFGLMVTLVWLYMEILRLLAIVNSNSR